MPPPDAVRDARAPVEARLAALRGWLAGEAPTIPAWLACFLEAMVRTGRPAEAVALANRAALGMAPPLPARLKGAEELVTEPYAWRGAISVAITAAGARAAADPALMSALFRGLLLWATAERDEVMAALIAADPDEDARLAGLSGLCAALAEVRDRPGERLMTVINAGHRHPRWLASLLDALARAPAGVAALQRLEWTLLPGYDALDAAGWSEADRGALRRVREAGVPLGRALAALALAAAPGEVSEEDLTELLASPGLPAWVRERAAEALLERGASSVAVGAAARAALPDLRRGRERLELLISSAAPPPAREVARAEGVILVPLPGELAGGPAEAQGRVWCLAREVQRRFPSGDWRAADERVSLVELDATGALTVHPLPVRTPARRTGAAGAERSWSLALRHGPLLVVTVAVPFADHRGWGTENHALGWDLEARRWVSLGWRDGALETHPLPSALHEDDLPSWGYGALLLWREGERICRFNDGTPYHLDDVDPDPQTRAALASCRAADPGWARLDAARLIRETLPLQAMIQRDPMLRDARGIGAVPLPGARALCVRGFPRWPGVPWTDHVAILTKGERP